MEGWRMIKLQDAELTSILPPYIKNNPDVQAISYAFKMGMKKFLQYAQLSALYGAVDILPEKMIDILALELQSQYYDESLLLEVKRGIVKNSLAWYSKGGTVSAVEELIQVVFGEGKLEEWFQFGGTPGTFRIKLNMGDYDTEINIQNVMEKIKRYKKLSAHFAAIVIGYYFNVPIYYTNAIHFRMGFYPQFNLRPLRLDRTWKLDREQKLSGYDGFGRIDLYPVRMKIQTKAGKTPKTKTQITFLLKAKEKIENSQNIKIRTSVACQKRTGERITIQASAAVNAGTEEIMLYNQNILDGKYKLNGKRKLNGGIYNI